MPSGYKNFFSSFNYSGVCRACSCGFAALPPPFCGATWRCFVSWSLKGKENVGCRRLGRFGQAFFRTATTRFVARCAHYAHDHFQHATAVAPQQIGAYDSRFSNYVSRNCGIVEEELDHKRCGTNRTRNSARLREPERLARSVAKKQGTRELPREFPVYFL